MVAVWGGKSVDVSVGQWVPVVGTVVCLVWVPWPVPVPLPSPTRLTAGTFGLHHIRTKLRTPCPAADRRGTLVSSAGRNTTAPGGPAGGGLPQQTTRVCDDSHGHRAGHLPERHAGRPRRLARVQAADLAEQHLGPGVHPGQLHPVRGGRVVPGRPHRRTTIIWNRLGELITKERRQGRPRRRPWSPRASPPHDPGYIDKDRELIVGLQTDAPLKRAIMPNGGWRMVENGLKAYGYEPDPTVTGHLHEVPQDPQRRRLRRLHPDDPRPPATSHIVTGLPDSYGRGRIIGDYRRVALYGVDRLIAAKREDRAVAGRDALQRRRDPRPRGARRADPGPGRAEGDGRVVRLRHLRAGRLPPARRSSGRTSRYLGGDQGAERRGHVAGAHLAPSWTSTSSGTSPRAG